MEINSVKNWCETETHIYFWGSIFSQWHMCKFRDKINNVKFTSAEQYMMWQKALTFNDKITAAAILRESDPKLQKALGRKVVGYKDDVWNLKRLDVVTVGNYLKFSQNDKLCKELVDTGDKVLVEGSPYDTIWGVGLNFDDDKILDEKNWNGQNLLGKALMGARKIIKEGHL